MKRLFGTPITDYLPAAALLLLTMVYLVTAFGYSAESRAMPVLIAVAMLILLLLDLVSRTRSVTGETLTRWLNPAAAQQADEPADGGRPKRQVAALLWLAGFTLALLVIGVLYAVPLYVFGSMRLRGRRSYAVSLAGGLGMTLLVWLLFAGLLRAPLYPGLLFGGG
jgi:hypothetical protein